MMGMISDETRYPKLRPVEPMAVVSGDQPGILLRDPLQLAQKMIIVPEGILPLLALMDGTREDAIALSGSLAIQYGVQVPSEIIQQLLDALDQTYLLENASYRAAVTHAVEEFHALPYRDPVHAGASYPRDPAELRNLLNGYLDSVEGINPNNVLRSRGGIISPHIDYGRGGKTYAQVWKRAAGLARVADLAVILGTDHYGQEPITLTTQSYATPFGVLPTPRPIIDAIAQAIGPQEAFAGELRHRTEHSIELAAVWLHHIRGGQPIDVVPVLCGSFRRFTQDGATPDDDQIIGSVLEALQETTKGRQVLVVAAGDLAHVGPAFEGEPVDLEGSTRLHHADAELMQHICAGDADGFLQAIKRVEDKNNVCGVPPIYLMLKMLSPIEGELIGYEQCPADQDGTSIVSIGGIVLS